MRLGLFDSGLGGLKIAISLFEALPDYDYIYLADAANAPYGHKTPEELFTLVKAGVLWLLANDCELVILACNTASAEALRRLQQEVLPSYPGRKILGVIVPTLEAMANQTHQKVGLLATEATVKSQAYAKEIAKLYPEVQFEQWAAPELASLIDEGAEQAVIDQALTELLRPIIASHLDQLILGCTHYTWVKSEIRQRVGPSVNVISQDELMASSLKKYLKQHQELANRLDRNGQRWFYTTGVLPKLELSRADWKWQAVTLNK